MNIIVTGDRGFIGTHLRRRLMDDGHVVYGVDVVEREGVAGFNCDIRDDLWFVEDQARGGSLGILGGKKADIAACVHLAALASPWRCQADPATAWGTNVQGTYNVLSLCRRLGVKRVIFPSSGHVYGISPKYLPTGEVHPLAIGDVYTATKVVGERLCESFWDDFGLSYCALRFYNVYGPGQSADYFLGKKIAEARSGGPVEMRKPLENTSKDWVHVSDVVEAVVRAVESDYVGTLNVGTGVETKLRDIVDAIASGYGVGVSEVEEGDAGPSRMCADIRNARAVLGWEPKVKFFEGLAALMDRK